MSRKTEPGLAAIVLDASGSMQPQASACVKTLNAFIDRRREDSGSKIRLTVFSYAWRIFHRKTVRAKDFPQVVLRSHVFEHDPLGKDIFVYDPEGGTALLDAINETLDGIERETKGKNPGRVLVAVFTDGQENSSRTHTLQATRQRIESWRELGKAEFVFFGADIDVFTEASKLGIPGRHAAQYFSSARGMSAAGDTLDAVETEYRTSGAIVGMGRVIPEAK